ncbi:tyrosine-type recombinase/integrase [Arsukibacterium sp.]|uniref:tyrosine-type recombinase/integrase n=1 Tax=Arsukibacterium sp. TaxID=1977258 RepID=UPI001BD55659|nr:tyrosine-type recombinase/integrase [Arsukibacterium sp.]MDX1537279.1 tyrosine-type recombinase/integrase [Arsukibacterium sp.]
MTQPRRSRLKFNAVIPPLERPLFNKTSIKSRSRQIDTLGDVWQIGESDAVTLNWSFLSRLPEELTSQVKYTFEYFLSGLAPDTVSGYFDVLKKFFNSVDEWESDESVGDQLSEYLFDYIATQRTQNDETSLSSLRHWYTQSHQLALSLFQRKTCQVLSKLKFKGNMKGQDVLAYIEGRSPFRSDELSKLRKALTECCSHITPYDPLFPKLVATWIFVVLGVRPRQLMLLMTCDFAVNIDKSNGHKTYMLNVPSVKKRYTLPRQRFKQRVLPAFLGELIEKQISAQYRDLFSDRSILTQDDQPIFRGTNASERKAKKVTFERFAASPGKDYFAKLPSEVMAFIDEKRVKDGLPALGLKLTPRRLRKTFATHAAAMGTPSYALMELLDHDDLQHVMVYYQLGVSFALKIDAVYQKHFTDHLAYFDGKITLKELVERNNVRTVFGPDSLRKLVGIGLCAKGAPCRLQPPYSCYGCNKFEASNDVSVHQEVLVAMQNEIREKFGDDAPPGFYTVTHVKACSELVERLEVGHE